MVLPKVLGSFDFYVFVVFHRFWLIYYRKEWIFWKQKNFFFWCCCKMRRRDDYLMQTSCQIIMSHMSKKSNDYLESKKSFVFVQNETEERPFDKLVRRQFFKLTLFSLFRLDVMTLMMTQWPQFDRISGLKHRHRRNVTSHHSFSLSCLF